MPRNFTAAPPSGQGPDGRARGDPRRPNGSVLEARHPTSRPSPQRPAGALSSRRTRRSGSQFSAVLPVAREQSPTKADAFPLDIGRRVVVLRPELLDVAGP